MEEMRLHGRGGQGVVVLSELIADAAVREGKFARTFPWFGAARRGAPVVSFLIIGPKEFVSRSMVYNPKHLIVLDPALHRLMNLTQGFREKGLYLQNSSKDPASILEELGPKVKPGKVGTVDATKIAMDITGRSIPNIVMLGSFVRFTGLISLDTAIQVVKDRFPREAEAYEQCIREGYDKVNVKEVSA
ncbi:MAG: hypothetical protein EF810_00535 [Candidatus Methanodesulfokora washburnensis]|uniref:pyruvate synthase n=1 Tax=Candidatus Methanodesulfokora washburnensis TaxID=2478471 RepID=A0A520KQ88_9CREN|nr:MAG: hypothetical protein EF810_00535 [Candidatus Methanodesulfokores washburnensis]